MTESVPAPILTADFGSIHTKVALFDLFAGEYRFIAAREVPTTFAPPVADVSLGLLQAIAQLELITGQTYSSQSNQTLLLPSQPDGSGIDQFVATASAGKPLRVVLVALTPTHSLQVASQLLQTSAWAVVEQVHLLDQRTDPERIACIHAAQPDLLLISGNAPTEILRLTELVAFSFQAALGRLTPPVLFLGMPNLHAAVQKIFAAASQTTAQPIQVQCFALPDQPNAAENQAIQQFLQTQESQGRAQQELAYHRLQGLLQQSQPSAPLLPTGQGWGRIVQFASKVFDPQKGVLGVDVGASQTIIAAGFNGELKLLVRPDLGLGASAPNLAKLLSPAQISRWLPFALSADQILDYLHEKSIKPATIPQQTEELFLEQAIAREILRFAYQQASHNWETTVDAKKSVFEPILAAGAILTKSKPNQAALILLDALQPVGITTLLLDQYRIAPQLGALAAVNPIAAVQLFGSGVFQKLGTVIAPIGQATFGQTVLRATLSYSHGETVQVEVPYGKIEVLPLPAGQVAQLEVQPLRGFDIGFGKSQARRISQLTGGTLGVIIDARGRPLQLPSQADECIKLNQNWLLEIGT
jgi:hypothetical protein